MQNTVEQFTSTSDQHFANAFASTDKTKNHDSQLSRPENALCDICLSFFQVNIQYRTDCITLDMKNKYVFYK